MPTPQEQVGQVETALRRRFFAHVPKIEKPDRANWTEVEHDVDRLSRALAAYALVGVSAIDDTTAAGAVTDGSQDGGIDALYFDRARARLVLVQSKFRRDGGGSSQAENLKTINGLKALINRRFGEFNEKFQQRLDELEEALDTPGVLLELVLVYLGQNLSPHVTNDLNALAAEFNALSPRLAWHSCGLTCVYEWLIAEQTPRTITVDIILENWTCITAPRRAVFGQIGLDRLAELVQTHGKNLFERNIRHYLGSIGVNSAIAETVRRKPGDFFYLNNGLTAVAESIVPAQGTPARCGFRLTNVSIVNGAQTAGAVAGAALAGLISPDAKVLVTIIETGQNQHDIALQITRARNYQTAVRGVDFAALDPQQERLRQELAVVGVTYFYRPSAEAKVRNDNAFSLEEAAVALACLSLPIQSSIEVQRIRARGQTTQNAVEYVVAAKKEIGRLWEQGGALYPALFTSTLSGVWMCRLVRIYRFLEAILSSTELSETHYYRRMFFRHARYFIAAFVAKRSPDVLMRPDLVVSDSDKTLLSQRTNELSELIYAQSVPLQGYRGYLSVFRNLTDSQPLADGVLQRLTEQDAQRQPAPEAAPAQPGEGPERT